MDVLLLFFCFSWFFVGYHISPVVAIRARRGPDRSASARLRLSTDRLIFPRDARALRRSTVFPDQAKMARKALVEAGSFCPGELLQYWRYECRLRNLLDASPSKAECVGK
jgi:hypothetical protein